MAAWYTGTTSKEALTKTKTNDMTNKITNTMHLKQPDMRLAPQCASADHYGSLLIFGYHAKCGKQWGLSDDAV